MTRVALATTLAVVLVTVGVAQEPLFEVASLKPDTRDLRSLPPTANSGPGEIRLVHVPLTNLILRGYPLPMPPIEIINLPGWAKDTFDFVAKAAPGATPEQQQQMFRAFLADRLKLTAHYESKDQKGYNLVFAHADHKLGLGLKPTTLDCTQASGRPVPGRDRDIVAFAATHCGLAMTDFDGTMTSGGLTMASLVRIIASTVDRPVIDQTGLSGFYAVSLRFLRFPSPAGSSPTLDEAPSVFTALPEQLGLKLEPATTTGQILVIDHIERPAED